MLDVMRMTTKVSSCKLTSQVSIARLRADRIDTHGSGTKYRSGARHRRQQSRGDLRADARSGAMLLQNTRRRSESRAHYQVGRRRVWVHAELGASGSPDG